MYLSLIVSDFGIVVSENSTLKLKSFPFQTRFPNYNKFIMINLMNQENELKAYGGS